MKRDRQRRQKRRGRRMALGLPQTLSELFAVPLILFVMSNPTFGLKDIHLPPLFGAPDQLQQVSTDTAVPLEVQVLADGKVLCTGQQVPVDDLVSQVTANIQQGQSIRLIIDENVNATVFIRIQSVLSQARLWNRVRIPHRSQQETSP